MLPLRQALQRLHARHSLWQTACCTALQARHSAVQAGHSALDFSAKVAPCGRSIGMPVQGTCLCRLDTTLPEQEQYTATIFLMADPDLMRCLLWGHSILLGCCPRAAYRHERHPILQTGTPE